MEIPTLDIPERTLLDLNMDDTNELGLSNHRSHSDQVRAEIFDLPVEQIHGFSKHCRSLAGKESGAHAKKNDTEILKSRIMPRR